MYNLTEITDKNQWNNYIENADFPFYNFLHSWEWGEVQESLGKNISRYGIFSDKLQIGVVLIIKVHAKRGNYIFIPHGPLVGERYKSVFFELLSMMLDFLISVSRSEGFDFIRCNSVIENTLQNRMNFKQLGFLNAPMHEHVEDTHILDLTQTEESLLKNMKKGDRYYITRALKEGVEITTGNTPEHIKMLTKMHTEHSKRRNGKVTYTPFTKAFIESLYTKFGDKITTISARVDGQVESILMTITFGKTCVYYIAASDIIHSKFSPNYLCQWEAIKEAKARGCTLYNFWGVSPDNNPKHPIFGVSKFKRKFGGSDYSLLHAQDFVITKKYYINYLIETFRRKKRGYYYKKLK